MKPPVLTKDDFARRYAAGEFGNASPTWDSVKDWDSKYRFQESILYHLRNRIKGGKTFYNLEGWRLDAWSRSKEGSWVHEPNWYVSEMAPTESTILQGEIMRSETGLYLKYTTVAEPMRAALAKEELNVFNLWAIMVLKKHMNNSSYEWLEYLLDEYPDHVIEFSTFSKCWGTVPRQNTVFWEVRLY